MQPDLGIVPYFHRWKTLYARMLGATAQPFHLTQNECDVLLFLHNNPQYNTATEISTLRMIAKSNVSSAIESLKRRGYLETARDPDNRRVVRLHLTDQAHEPADQLRATQTEFNRIMKQNIAPQQLELLLQLLDKMNENAMLALATLEQENKE